MLVVTYYDPNNSLNNILGPSIVRSCKSKLVPVGEFSKESRFGFLERPNLFDIRFPSNTECIPSYIANLYDGFKMIREHLNVNPQITKNGMKLSNIMANIAQRDEMYNEFYWYTENIDRSNNNLVLYMTEYASNSGKPNQRDIKYLLTYVIGHLFLNSVLKYPGPILSEDVLCSYLSIKRPAPESLQKIFSKAKYKGPFCKLGRFYWRRDIDTIIFNSSGDFNGDYPGEGAFNRAVLKKSRSISKCI